MTASISLAFLPSKSEAIYRLAISTFRELIIGNTRIKVILIDDEDALKNALSSVYLGVL